MARRVIEQWSINIFVQCMKVLDLADTIKSRDHQNTIPFIYFYLFFLQVSTPHKFSLNMWPIS